MSYQRARTLFSVLLLTVVTAGCPSDTPSEPEPPPPAAPTVTSVTANAGTIAGGTSVTIAGTGFVAVPSVTFGGTPATGIAFSGSTSIVATTPAHAAGAVSVVVTNPDAQSGTLANGFTYTAPPAVTSVTPGSGSAAGNTAITIAGTGFVAGATVTIGGSAATAVSVAGSTSITATTTAHAAGAASVVVTNPDGQSSTLANGFTYVAGPTVTGVTPNSGPPAGGVQVTITGTGFAAVPTVTFGGSAATGVAFINSTSIIATVPAHAAGAVAVIVSNPDGQSAVLPNGFTYAASGAPQPTSVSPASGIAAGGYTVTITGTGFVANPTVTFGGTASATVAFASSTSITAAVPAHAAGKVAVVVRNPDGQSGTLADGFTYVASVAPPTVTNISPATGGIGGGQAITITGTGFVQGTMVAFGGSAATAVSVAGSTSLTATTPPHAAGAVDVTVTNPDGQFVTVSNGFTYVTGPTVTDVTPNSGALAGGVQVTITGTGFTAVPTVMFGGTAATGAAFSSSTQLLATVPAHAAGAVDVVVTNPNGQSGTLAAGFTYRAAPQVTSISANTGGIGGGDWITITGTGFVLDYTDVQFGAVYATQVIASATSISVYTPPRPITGLVDVTVTTTTPNGQSVTVPNGFTYVPTVTSIIPATGFAYGGEDIVIEGTGFMAGTTVLFGSDPATEMLTGLPTVVVATTPSHLAGIVDVTVTNPDGTYVTLPGQFTYVPPTKLEKTDWQVSYLKSDGSPSFSHDAQLLDDVIGALTGSLVYGSGTTALTSGYVKGNSVVVQFEFISAGGSPIGTTTCTGVISKPAGQPQQIAGTFTATGTIAVLAAGTTCVLR